MVAGDHKFHPECFCCTSCGGFIGDGESYALVERSKLYWLVFQIIMSDIINVFSLNECNSYRLFQAV
jgi:hypothetical protein